MINYTKIMIDEGFPWPQNPIYTDGAWHAFDTDKKGKRNGRYIATRTYFYFCDHATGYKRNIYIKLYEKENEKKNATVHEKFLKLSDSGTTGYCRKKKITPYKARFAYNNNMLCIPMHDYGLSITKSVQYIHDNDPKKKKFAKGQSIKNLCLTLDREAEYTVLCEGYATGCTIFEYCDRVNVIICFSIGNLVSMFLRYSDLRKDNILLAVDNDEAGLHALALLRSYDFNNFVPPLKGDWNDIISRDLGKDEELITVDTLKILLNKKLEENIAFINKKRELFK